MNSRERLRCCFFHEEMDRPGVYTRTGYPHDDPTYDKIKAYMAEHSDLKLNWSVEQFETKYEFTDRTEPHSDDFERYVVVLHTPKGDLEYSTLLSLKGQPGLHETYLIKTRYRDRFEIDRGVMRSSGPHRSAYDAPIDDREEGERNPFLSPSSVSRIRFRPTTSRPIVKPGFSQIPPAANT